MKKPIRNYVSVFVFVYLLLSLGAQAQTILNYNIHAPEGTLVRGLVSSSPQSLYRSPANAPVKIDLVEEKIDADILSGMFGPSGLCNSDVPFIVVDFSGQPAGIFKLNDDFRNGLCCGVRGGGNRCFEVLLILSDLTAAVTIKFDGATATGSANWWLTPLPAPNNQCALESYKVGDQACVTGGGMYALTFCKPGQNNYNLIIEAIPHPGIDEKYEVRQDCSIQLNAMGFVNQGVTWSGDHLGALDFSTGMLTPTFTWKPGMPLFPDYIEYSVCGPVSANNACTNHIGQVCATTRIYVYPELTAGILPVNPKFCKDGSVVIQSQVSGGKPPYRFSWVNPFGEIVSETPSVAAAEAGEWRLKVSDQLSGSNCASVEHPFAVEKVSIGLTATVVNEKCFDEANGSITANVSGGTAPLHYAWSHDPALNGPMASHLKAGTYNLKVTDANGCVVENTFEIKAGKQFVASISAKRNTTLCQDGPVELTATAGATYLWSNGLTTRSIEVVESGKYSVLVTSEEGCKSEASIEITINNAPQVSLAPFANVCEHGPAFELTGGLPLGGVYSGPGVINGIFDPNRLGAGTYEITYTYTSEKGCTGSATATIFVQTMFAFYEIVDAGCFGESNGAIFLEVHNGNGDYTFKWNNGATTQNLENIPAGIYSVEINDGINCKLFVVNMVVGQSSEIKISGTVTQPTYMGANNGAVAATVSGGKAPYTFAWSNGANTPEINNLKPGNYSVTVTDSTGCQASADFTIEEGSILVDLQVTIEVNIATPDPEKVNELIFAVVVTNLNPLIDATGVTVENIPPSLFPYIARLDAGTHGTFNPATGIWNIGTIPAGKFALLVYRTGMLLSEANPSAKNAVQIMPFDQTDPNLINNYDEVVVAIGESSGGNDGGIESDGSMASKIALRFHRRMVEGAAIMPEERLEEMPAFDVTEMLTGELKSATADETPASGISFFIPERGPAQTRAFVSTPADLLAITNANEIFAVDYLQDNNARRAAILAIATDAGSVYEHTKVICDRLTGATLQEIRHIQIAGQPFILSKLVHPNGYTDYSVSFIATWKNNGFTIDNRWHNELYNPTGTGEVFNFQVWSVAPQITRELVEGILASMGAAGQLNFKNATALPQIPKVFVQAGKYRNGKLLLDLINTNGASKITLHGTKAVVENGDRQKFQIDVNIPSTPFSTVEVNVGYLFDAGFSIANNLDETRDVLYYADGPWMFDYDPGNSVVTHFSTEPETGLLHDKSYGVERNASMKGTVRTYASLFRRLGPGTQPMDLSRYNQLAFHASGIGTVEVMLAKAGIKTWDRQFRTLITLQPAGKDYVINLSDLKTAEGLTGFTAEDLISVIFNPIGNGAISSNFELNVSRVHFTNQHIVANQAGIFYTNYPNPFTTSTNIEFVVASESRVKVEVLNMLGQTMEVLKDNTLQQGSYKVNWTPKNMRPGMFMFRVTVGNQSYTGKMVYRP